MRVRATQNERVDGHLIASWRAFEFLAFQLLIHWFSVLENLNTRNLQPDFFFFCIKLSASLCFSPETHKILNMYFGDTIKDMVQGTA